jgi:cysteine synthase
MQTVGNTPLVELRNLAPTGTRLFAKLEWYNPTGSVKDRAAFFMYEDAVKTGKLRRGQPMVEATSGNTGIGLARIAIVNGHKMIICIPAAATEERKQVLRAYGAELVEVDGPPAAAIAKAEELVAEGVGHMCYQYENEFNPYSHEVGTSQEILREWDLEAPPTHFFAPYGTGGTLTGNTRGLAPTWPTTRMHSVEPHYEDPIGGMRSQDDPFQPIIADLALVTDQHQIHRDEADAMVFTTMHEEGQFVGTSSGAVLKAAVDTLSREGGTAVALLPDAGWKYLSGAPWIAT